MRTGIRFMGWSLVVLAACLFAGSPCPADLKIAPSVAPEMLEHTRHFEKKVYKIGENVYSAVGYSLANAVMVVGDDGVILVDVTTTKEDGAEAWAALREYTEKPVKAVVYTHFHPDHWGGVRAFVSEEDVKAGKVEIISHDTLLDNVVRQGGLVGPILSMRTAYSFGAALPPEDLEGMHDGIGPKVNLGLCTFIAPTRTFHDEMDLTIAGVKMHLEWVPSEAPDEIVVYLPEEKTLLSAEVIQGPTLPNIHTLRGTKFRDPVQWYESIDRLRAFQAENMVPSHGQPVYGAEKVEEVLRMTRDGIQFVHDQTIRYMNKGLTPDELAEAVAFPAYLAEYRPYLREYYGTVKHSSRQIYAGYLGWFAGDPVDLDPTPPVEKAERTVKLMGGRNKVLAAAKKAFEQGDNQWAAELCTLLVRINKEDLDARDVKAAAFRRMGYASINSNWRNWYLMAAMELEGKIVPASLLGTMSRNWVTPDIMAQWPASRLIQGMTVRLKAEDTLDTHLTAGFRFPDTGEACGLEIRRGVAQFHDELPGKTDFTLTMPKRYFLAMAFGKATLEDGLSKGIAQLEGKPEQVARFFAAFDSPMYPIQLTLR
jgi:alkyl sulfatase BDS1-like metallo-beta-lactamase superfamily hydrolase